MARVAAQAGIAGAPPEPAQRIDALEAQLKELGAALAGQVATAQASTLGRPPSTRCFAVLPGRRPEHVLYVFFFFRSLVMKKMECISF